MKTATIRIAKILALIIVCTIRGIILAVKPLLQPVAEQSVEEIETLKHQEIKNLFSESEQVIIDELDRECLVFVEKLK